MQLAWVYGRPTTLTLMGVITPLACQLAGVGAVTDGLPVVLDPA